MAAAALLTLAGSNNARDEIVRVGGISSLVQVLQSEGGTFQFSLTGKTQTFKFTKHHHNIIILLLKLKFTQQVYI